MINPVLIDDAFLEDVARARDADESFHLWWLGQSGFLLKWKDRHLIMDPYLSDSLAKKHENDPARPHVRMTAPVVKPIQLDFIDVATVSHNHADHMDRDTLRDIWTVSPAMRLVIPEANRSYVSETLGIHQALATGIDDGMTIECADFHITGVAAAHDEFEQDAEGRHKFLGYVFKFGDGFTIYHSGDTVVYDGLAERLQALDIDVALLPINGNNPERGVSGNMNGEEAAQLAKEIGAGVAIPCHYNMFAFNTASPDQFVAKATEVGQAIKILEAGERWSNTA